MLDRSGHVQRKVRAESVTRTVPRGAVLGGGAHDRGCEVSSPRAGPAVDGLSGAWRHGPVRSSEAFRQAREILLIHRTDLDAARRAFRWPELDEFNWARDWFDELARGNDRTAIRVVSDEGLDVRRTFRELSEVSDRIASSLRRLGVAPGDRLLIMLGNELPLWEAILAIIKLGAVIVPATTQLTADDLEDRFARGNIRHVIAGAASAPKFARISVPFTRIAVGPAPAGWEPFEALYAGPSGFTPDRPTRATDPLLLYFTSGTTAKPKLVLHTHQSYPVGHLSTMYWLGVQEGDVHLNISSPGWAKHAWSSVFAPWNAGATVLAYDYGRFQPQRVLDVLRRCEVSTLCAPPTVWRMMILHELGSRPDRLRELASAGEPLNPEVIERVRAAWGLTIRDGYGQTETTAQIGNCPGQPGTDGAMGRPLPGYAITLVSSAGEEGAQGEIAVRVGEGGALGMMAGYLDNEGRTREVMGGGLYRTGDEAVRAGDEFTFVGRQDDVFKSSDYRISPFELESALLEHPAVAEAAVVPSPDPTRLSVPKAFITLKPGTAPSPAIAEEIFRFSTARLAPYKRIRRLQFRPLPKTISGKIRRVELRAEERAARASGGRGPDEFYLEDFSPER